MFDNGSSRAPELPGASCVRSAALTAGDTVTSEDEVFRANYARNSGGAGRLVGENEL
jgi:hypothetical protein